MQGWVGPALRDTQSPASMKSLAADSDLVKPLWLPRNPLAGMDPDGPWASSCQLRSGVSPAAKCQGPGTLCVVFGCRDRATRLLSVPKTETSLGHLWVRS